MTATSPWRALAVALAAAVLVQTILVINGVPPAGIVVVVVLLFLTALKAPAVVSWPMTALTMAVLGTVEVLAARHRGQDHDLIAVVLLVALAAVAGLSLRYHRAYVGEAVARAEAAERGAEAEARRRVADDRLRIARDLHDSVAHHMAVVNLQASAAQRLLDRDPSAAGAMLSQVQDAARTALAETSTMVGELREGAAPLTPGSTSETPGAEAPGMEGLAAPVLAGGGEVRWHGDPVDRLPAEFQVVAHRVLTEAFTNAGRHAPGSTVDVTVTRTAAETMIKITNGPATRPVATAPSGGHGLLGMRERVERIGGRLTAGPTPGGGFDVTARFIP